MEYICFFRRPCKPVVRNSQAFFEDTFDHITSLSGQPFVFYFPSGNHFVHPKDWSFFAHKGLLRKWKFLWPPFYLLCKKMANFCLNFRSYHNTSELTRNLKILSILPYDVFLCWYNLMKAWDIFLKVISGCISTSPLVPVEKFSGNN